jgi:molybdopterin adenylyltransferase
MRLAILTVSDAGARGERVDTSGDAIAAWAATRGYDVTQRTLVPDDTGEIVRVLLQWCDGDLADLVITTGGTGLSVRDVTPEATGTVLEREAPGIAERIRAVGMTKTPHAALSRGLAGTRGRTLVINLPGSTPAVQDGLETIEPFIDHAVKILRGETTSHAPPR